MEAPTSRCSRFVPRHEVALQELPVEGPVLDIGGGGEGVIGRLEEDRVLAIDISKAELRAAPGSPVKAVMDALDMPVVSARLPTSPPSTP